MAFLLLKIQWPDFLDWVNCFEDLRHFNIYFFSHIATWKHEIPYLWNWYKTWAQTQDLAPLVTWFKIRVFYLEHIHSFDGKVWLPLKMSTNG